MAPAIRLLYVDDEPTLLDIGKLFLEAEGEFAVDTLTSAKVALTHLNTVRYDAIISDYQMPEMDGITFLKQLKASGNTTPFIIFTGRGREEIVIEALNEGADFYLQKGGEPRSQFAELAHKIRSAVSRQKTEKLAKDTERRLYDIINFLPDATFAIDTEGNVIAWNRAIEEMTGVSARDMLGKGNYEYSIPFYGERRPILIDLVSIPDEELTQSKYSVIKKEGDILIAETSLPRPLGRYSVLSGKASLLYNDERNVIGAIESIRDITEQKQAQAALHESEKRFRELSDLLPQIVYETDNNGNLTYANHIAFERFGYSEDEFRQGLNVLQMIAPLDRERAAADLRRMFEGGQKTGPAGEYVALRKDGSTFPISIYSSPVFVNDRMTGIRGIIVDITDRKRAEEELRQSEQKYRLIADNTADYIWIFDMDFNLTYVSPSVEKMRGFTVEEVLSQPLEQMMTPRSLENVMNRLGEEMALEATGTADPDRIVSFETEEYCKDGSTILVENSVTLLRDNEDNPVGMLGVSRDVTGRRRAEQELQRKNRALETINQLAIEFASLPHDTSVPEQAVKKLMQLPGAVATLYSAYDPSDRTLQVTHFEIAPGMLQKAVGLLGKRPGDMKIPVSKGMYQEIVSSIIGTKQTLTEISFGQIPPLVSTSIQTMMGIDHFIGIAFVIEGELYGTSILAMKHGESDPSKELLESFAHIVAVSLRRSRAEATLHESEKRFCMLLEHVPSVAVQGYGMDGTTQYWNQASERLYGYTSQEALGKNLVDLIIPPEMQEDVRKAIVSMAETGQPIPASELSLMRKDGSRVGVFSSHAIVKNSLSGMELFCIDIDITELRRAEETLRESEDRYRTLVEISPDAVILHQEGKIIYLNPAAVTLLGALHPDEIIGNNVLDYVQADFRDAVRTNIQKDLEGDLTSTIELPLVRTDGTVVIVEGRGIRTVINGKPAVQVALRDVTERRRAEDRLSEINRAFLSFGPDPLYNITILTGLAGKMLQGTCALYNRLEGGMLCSIGMWNTPPDFAPCDRPEGHICNDVIHKGGSSPVIIPNLLESSYAETDPNVRRYQLKTYVGIPVQIGESFLGSLCVVYQDTCSPTPQDLEILSLLAHAVAIEDERRTAGQALLESKVLLREVFDNANDAIFLLERTPRGPGNYLLVNDKAVRMLGYSQEELLKMSPRDIVPEDIQKKIMPGVIQKLLKNGHATFESAHRRKDGSIYPVEVSTHTFVYQGKDVDLSIIRDITERKRAEEALRESHDRFEATIASLDEAVFLVDPATRVISGCNAAATRIFGYSHGELVGRETNILHVDQGHVEQFGREASATYGEPGYFRREFEMRRKDGCVFPTEHFVRPLHDPDGRILYVVSVVRDITERKRAEEAQRLSEEKYRIVAEGAGEGIAIVLDGRLEYVNPYLADMTGYSAAEIMGTSFLRFVSSDSVLGLLGVIKKAILGEPVPTLFKTRIRHRDGHLIEIEASGSTIPWKGKKALLGIIRDITQQQKMEEALRESEEKYRTLVESSSDMIWEVDVNGTYSYVSPNIVTLLGYTPEEVIGRAVFDFIVPAEVESVGKAFNACVVTLQPMVRLENTNIHKDGHFVVLETSGEPVLDSSGNLIGYRGIDRDITERKRADEALRQANRKLTLLSSITRHDINNQLTVLQGYLTILGKKQPDTPDNEYFQKVATAAERISSIIRFTKEYEKIGVRAPTWQDCRTLIDTAAKQAPLGHVTIKNDIPAVTNVFADPLIIRVCYNLMDNAVRYGGKITTIRFSEKEHDGNLIIACEDDGDGVPADEKERIFDRGFGKNTGMGLFLVREILAITGITIKETGEPGKGARFEMTVPKGMWRIGKEPE